VGLVILLVGCGAASAEEGLAAFAAPRGIDQIGQATYVLLGADEAIPEALTLIGHAGTCTPTEARPSAPASDVNALRIESSCAPRIALDREAPGARLVPLRFESMPSGRGRVGSAESWTVRLEYGPDEDGCPGLPGHVQVKLGTEAVLRQNTWLRVDRILLLTTGARAWLVLTSPRRAEAIPLGPGAERVTWTLPSGAEHTSECD